MVTAEEASIQKTKEKLKAIGILEMRVESASLVSIDTHQSDISSMNFKQI